jgi:hypothetical protein
MEGIMKHAASDLAPAPDPAAQFLRDGFHVARQMVPRAQVDRIFSDMHRLAAQQLRRLGLPYGRGDTSEAVHQDLKTLFDHDPKVYVATLTLCAKLVSLFELYLHPAIRGFAREIGIAFPVFQTAPVMHVMSKSLKIPGGYQGLGAHQDWPTLQGSLDTVTVWIPFVDVDKNRFTLDIIPRSHTDGLRPYARRDHIFEVDPGTYDASGFQPVEAARGDVVFMSSFAIHRSSLKGDDRLRVSTSMRYENAAEPHFVERCYPFAHKRSVVAELITPDFPQRDQVAAVYSPPGKAS